MTLGEKIQKLRKSCGLSQLQLAEQLDVSRQSVSKWELNESVPDINKIVRLSELFSVSVDELLKEQYTSYVENVDTKSTIEDIVQMNYINSLIKIGIKTTILGTVLIVLECLFLPVLAIIQKSQVNGQGFYTDFIYLIDKGGEDVVALGTDFDGIPPDTEIADMSQMSRLYDAFKEAGLSVEQCEKLFWKNADRLLKEIL